MSPVTTKYMPLPCLPLLRRPASLLRLQQPQLVQQQQRPHRHLLQRCHLCRRRDLHRLRDLVLLQRRVRSFAYEKETHCSVRLIRLSMKRARTAQSGFFPLRVLLTLFVWAIASWILGATVLGFFTTEAPKRVSQRQLTFAERVVYQRAIENVHWRHRIWPKGRADAKPSLDAMISQAQLERRVIDYVRKSQALDDYWQRPITAEQLQAEMDRMAKHSKQPEVLRELFAALGDDPFVIAECLARPVLAERLITNFAGSDGKPLESWRERADSQISKLVGAPVADYVLPVISTGSGCMEDTWTATAGEPDGRDNHTAVWTGTEMIIWGGGANSTNTGGRYNPSTDTWTPTSTMNAPQARSEHTAVWTGTEMIIWGGSPVTNTGGRYNPGTDTWTATSTANAPIARVNHVAVWTGTEMIVWGGWDGGATFFDTGGRYNPNTDTWTATSTTNAPTGRYNLTAVWTGSEMIVWGGRTQSAAVNTGARYNPGTDSWVAISTTNVPAGRFTHTAAWTGTDMIVWGGIDFNDFFNTGGKYHPATDTWTSTSTTNAPSARAKHTAVWSGTQMIVWGGYNFDPPFQKNTGGRYNPNTNSWTDTDTTSAPEGRSYHTAIWNGNEMIVWGGYVDAGRTNTGGRYNPSTNDWVNTGNSNAPSSRVDHTAVWTGTEMIVWGGAKCNTFLATCLLNTGGRYIPALDNWIATSTANAPSARFGHTAIWTGDEMVVWGGGGPGGFSFDSGGKYNPGTDNWTPTNTSNAPFARHLHTAVWTGSEMIVWGGVGGFLGVNTGERDWKPPAGSTPTPTPTPNFNTGARYNPNTDSWVATSTTNAPMGRDGHTAVWADNEMIVWGGESSSGNLNSGGRYNPRTDSWTPTTTTNAPDARSFHTAVWTGSEMIVWGAGTNTGGRYNPSTDSWVPTSTTNAPEPRYSHTGIWTDGNMIVWGGINQVELNTGGKYDPSADSWIATGTAEAPAPRESHTAIWTGSEMIVWGGVIDYGNAVSSTGGRYCAQSGPTPTPTPTATPAPTPCTGRCNPTPRPRPTPHPRP
jgi:N-acetylneuraminic acid mutarotase